MFRSLFRMLQVVTGRPARRSVRTLSLEGLHRREMLAYDAIQLTSAAGGIDDLVMLGDTAYFASASKLWKTDGTLSGSMVVVDFGPASLGSITLDLEVLNGELAIAYADTDFFGGAETKLFKLNDTESGVVELRDFGVASSYSDAAYFVSYSGELYFSVADQATDTGRELWKTDLTETGTVAVTEFMNPGDSGSYPYGMYEFNGELYFSATSETFGQELWKTDGTEIGTMLVKDLDPGSTTGGPNSAYPNNLTQFNGQLFFSAMKGFEEAEIWKTDGTDSGTVLVSGLGSDSTISGSYYGAALVPASGKLFFAASQPDTGTELWVTDGTGSGTMLVRDINPGFNGANPLGSFPANLTEFGGEVYFNASVNSQTELWKSNGTESGTLRVADNLSSGFYDLTEFDGELFFIAGEDRDELWKTDGVSASSVFVDPSGNFQSNSQLVSIGQTLYVLGEELWRLQPTLVEHQFRSDTFVVSGTWSYSYTESGYMDSATGTYQMDGTLSYSSPTDGTGTLSALGAPSTLVGSGADFVDIGFGATACSTYQVEHLGTLTFNDLDGAIAATSGAPTQSSYLSYTDQTGGFCPAGDALEYSPFNYLGLFIGTYEENNNATLAFGATLPLTGGTISLSAPGTPVEFAVTAQTDLAITASANEVVVTVTGRHMNSGGNRAAPVTTIISEYLDANGNVISGTQVFAPVDVYWNSSQVNINVAGITPPANAVSWRVTVDAPGVISESSESNNSATVVLSGENPPWQNPDDRRDVNANGTVAPIDALVILNELGRERFIDAFNVLPAIRPDSAFFYDVNGDGKCTPIDALIILNFLSRLPSSSEQVLVSPSGDDEADEHWSLQWDDRLSLHDGS